MPDNGNKSNNRALSIGELGCIINRYFSVIICIYQKCKFVPLQAHVRNIHSYSYILKCCKHILKQNLASNTSVPDLLYFVINSIFVCMQNHKQKSIQFNCNKVNKQQHSHLPFPSQQQAQSD